MRWEAWPALLAALAWAFILGALLATYVPGVPLEWLALLVIAGVPLAVCLRTLTLAWRKAERSGLVRGAPAPVPTVWRRRLILAVALALLLGAVGVDLLTRPSSFEVGLDAPLRVSPLLPGPSGAWAYLVGLVLTVGAVARTRTAGLLVAGGLAIAAVVGGTALVWNASAAVPTMATANDGECPELVSVPVNVVRSTATGELDGLALGDVKVHPNTDQPFILVAEYDTRWGDGIAVLPWAPAPGQDPLQRSTLNREARITVDDLGADVVDGRAARHCQFVIDGRSAVEGFPALRWLVGENEGTTDPGAGLEAWRGTLDYWLVTTWEPRVESVNVVLATVFVDGQPPGWPFPGLRASLKAASWFGGS